ncbi:triose-phosphate isomerase [Brevundimonas sp.]|uniref:triose-phosphate isomerase n=1 Tax=Brevundimonas sp. TaxID=1871086 RepID=UPI00262A06F8|nr:triose-phosphate isomerase [Brevundimonas sp.]
MMKTEKLIAGNWKMNGLGGSLGEVEALRAALAEAAPACRVALCPPATLIERMARAAGEGIEIGGQDCRAESHGAFTGDVSAAMLRDAGATLVILGHSERRQGHGETDSVVAAKAEAALSVGLEPIICVGETLEQREAGRAVEVVRGQVMASLPAILAEKGAFAVAYEPVWAIGTGLTPSLEQIEAVHRAVRAAMIERLGPAGAARPILYGGSVKPDNAREILAVPEVGGALVGGASLKAADFLGIVRGV